MQTESINLSILFSRHSSANKLKDERSAERSQNLIPVKKATKVMGKITFVPAHKT